MQQDKPATSLVIALTIAGLIFFLGLIWQVTINDIIKEVFPENSVVIQLLMSVIITIFVVIIIIGLVKYFELTDINFLNIL